jgi:two-component sensor histidine kinase
MATAPARSSVALAFAGDRATTFHSQTAPPVEKSFRPIDGLLALSERPAGVMAVTTVSALLSRIPGSTRVGFGHYLRDLCDDLAGTFSRSSGPQLTYTAADEVLPIGAVITLGLIADLLITNAFVYAFPAGSGGRIAVSFMAGPETWQLTVEDSGSALQDDGDRRDHGLTIARLLVLRLNGRVDIPSMTEGTRCIVTIPRPAARLDATLD